MFVTVTDGNGRLVPNLTQDNFEVHDEGRPQPITLFDNSPQPIRLISGYSPFTLATEVAALLVARTRKVSQRSGKEFMWLKRRISPVAAKKITSRSRAAFDR